tara:strand:+ start:216 stop:527 length:312 start_codon:yes stop_codon:yes gene_type:complete
MATHRNLRSSVRTITVAIAAVRNDGGDWLKVAHRIDSLESRARSTYGEDMETECADLYASLMTAKDSAADWKGERLAFAAGRAAPSRELTPAELTYAAELRAL